MEENKFQEGQIVEVFGMVDHPEFNGNQVRIKNKKFLGKDYYPEYCPSGIAWYIEGITDPEINKYFDWLYQERLMEI